MSQQTAEQSGAGQENDLSRQIHTWQDGLQGRSLSLLLMMELVFIFLIVPLVETHMLGRIWVTGFQLLLALVSIFVMAGIGLARLVIGLGFVLTLATSPSRALSFDQDLLHSLGLFLFQAAVTFGIIRVVFSAGEVTHHRIQGAVLVYLNLALVFATIFNSIVLLVPTAFTHVPPGLGHQFGPLLYFSFSTLTTTGYGDIVPVHPIARSVANLEAAVGQVYLTTLLARLVSLHVARRNI